MSYTLENTIGELLDDSIAVEVIEKYAPGFTTHPLLIFAKGMTLKSLLNFPQAQQNGLTEQKVMEVLREIEMLRNN